MAKPTKPTPPDRALRSDPATFSARAEGWITYQWSTFPDYLDSLADFVDDAATALLTTNLPPLTGKAGQFVTVNGTEDAVTLTQPFGTFGATLAANETVADARTDLGLGTAALRAAADAVADDETLPDGAAVTAYVDSAVIPDAGAVGSTVLARGTADVAFGGTTAGSNLTPTSAFWGLPSDAQGQSFPVGSALSGTWRCEGQYTHNFSNLGNNQGATLWRRIS